MAVKVKWDENIGLINFRRLLIKQQGSSPYVKRTATKAYFRSKPIGIEEPISRSLRRI